MTISREKSVLSKAQDDALKCLSMLTTTGYQFTVIED